MSTDIVVVSGLPRSGTSLLMQLLDAGGIEVVTDNVRTADTDNPRGYYEFERVKKVKRDPSWLPETRGKAVKMISQLLYDLPPSESYRIIFMERDLAEVLDSQEKMLRRLGRESAPRDEMMHAFTLHLDRLHRWLAEQANVAVLRVGYAALVAEPDREARRISEFLGGRLNVAAAVRAIDPSLYRNRGAVQTATASGDGRA
jgi:hypothetical protein